MMRKWLNTARPKKAVHTCSFDLLARCKGCGKEAMVDSLPYSVYQSIDYFLRSKGFLVVVGRKPFEYPCKEGDFHEWDARVIMDVKFRKCGKCGLIQRLCYQSAYDDYGYVNDPVNKKLMENWDNGQPINPDNPSMGTPVRWA